MTAKPESSRKRRKTLTATRTQSTGGQPAPPPAAAGDKAELQAAQVTVIVPVFNKAPYLTACLDSILQQTLRDIAVICVDDASTDGSADILARYAEIDTRLRVIRVPFNRGPGHSRNVGIAAATSQYVQFTDADDILPDGALEKLFRRARQDKVEVVRGTISQFWSATPDTLEILDSVPDKSLFVPLDEKHFWIPWWHPAYLFSRVLLLQNSISFPQLRSGEDPVFLATVLVHARRMSTIADVTYHYRVATAEEKGRAGYLNLRDYVQHAWIVKNVFLEHRPECWTDGYGPFMQRRIEKQIQSYPVSDLEHRRVLEQANAVFTEPARERQKVLYVYRVCGLGGVETSVLNKMEALRRQKITAHVLFLQMWGEGGQSIAQRPDVHVRPNRDSQLELLKQGWDAVVLIDTPEFLQVVEESLINCRVFMETHASYCPALESYYSNIGDQAVAAVIAPSLFNKSLLLERGCPEEKIQVIPNAIDPAVFNAASVCEDSSIAALPEGVPLILSIGRLEIEKNTLEFVQVAIALLAEGVRAHYVIVGDGVSTADYAAEVRAAIPAGKEESFSFLPRVRYEEMPGLYSRSAESGGCLLVTSLHESQPMTILEAMATGCCAVAANVGGVGELICDAVNGRLYELGDIEAAAAAVRRVIEDPSERGTISRQAFDLVRLEHSPETTAQLYAALLHRARRRDSPSLMSQTPAGRLAARLDALVSDFISLHTELVANQAGPATRETALAALFSEPMVAASEQSVTPYSQIIPGVQIGFEPTAKVFVTVQPKQEFSRSPDTCLNTLTINFTGTSRWLTLEVVLSWGQLQAADRYQFGLYAQPNRTAVGKAVLRFARKGGGMIDHRFAELRLSSSDRSCHRRGALRLPDLSEADKDMPPKLLFFLDSKSDLTLRVDYLTVYFS
jgi:glycosyltransferase involved in cell wall biosynthesis